MTSLSKHKRAFQGFFRWKNDSQREAVKFFVLIFCQAFLEMGALAIIFPYFQYLESGELTILDIALHNYFDTTDITLFVCLAVMAIGIIRFLILKRVVTFAYFQEMRLSRLVMNKLLRYPYIEFHKLRRTDIYRLVATEIPQAVNAYFVGIIHILMSLVSIVFIGMLLLSVNTLMTFFSIFCLFALYALILLAKNKNIAFLGDQRLSINSNKFKTFGNVLDSFKAIRISDQAPSVESEYNKLAYNYARVHSDIQFATLSPRVIIEGTITIIVVSGSYFFATTQLVDTATLPELIFFAVAAVKMLPHFQIIYSRWASANYTLPTVLYVHEELEKLNSVELKSLPGMPREYSRDNIPKSVREIEINNISLYIDGKGILNNIDYTFRKGFVNVIRGPSGSGKTTLLNIISGLTAPTSGSISVNGKITDLYENKLWFTRLSYVDQFPYLAGETVSDLLNEGEKFEASSDDVWLLEKFSGLGFGTEFCMQDSIYQGGLNFSGGQRQRLAFISAIRKSSGILLLDEVNAGLDDENERKVFEIIDSIVDSRLVILISHNPIKLERHKIRYLDIENANKN